MKTILEHSPGQNDMQSDVNEHKAVPLRALVVDDDEDSAGILEKILEILGFEARVASNGTEALREANDFRPKLILLDIRMPKLDGYDTCRVIRAQPWGKDVRLVAITGEDKGEIENRSERAGFDAYLIKPVSFENIRKIAESAK